MAEIARLTSPSRPLSVINSIEDLRVIARRRIPRALFDYIDRGSYDEVTWTRNRDDLRAIELRQRVMVDVSRLAVGTTVLGEHWKMPVGLAPTGLTGFFHRDGEIEAARAAQAAGVPFMPEHHVHLLDRRRARRRGGHVLVSALSHARPRLQCRADRARARGALLRPHAHARSAFAGIAPARSEERPVGAASDDSRQCVGDPLRPRWLAGVLLGRRRTLGNLAAFFPERGIGELSEWVGGQFDPSITWKDVAWVRERWPGKLVLKGILDGEDARLAADAGVDAIVVSNHGGRQLDGATSTIAALPRVVDAVAGRCEVLLDGGVTSGQDVLKALALGARACLIGKAFLYGLAARGGEGVTLALQIIQKELEVSMALCGVNDVRNAGPQALVP